MMTSHAYTGQTIRDYGRDHQVRISLPMPPSSNNMFVNVAGKGRAKSKEYNSWGKTAAMLIMAQRPRKFDIPVRIKIEVNNPRGLGFDLDNRIKAIQDALVTSNVIVDDSARWVRGVEICVVSEGAECTVIIEASYPTSANAPNTAPAQAPRSPTSNSAEFSKMTKMGRNERTSRMISPNRPLRSPVMPARRPAIEMSWQGNPPVMTSMSSSSSPFIAQTSSNWRTPGHMRARSERRSGLISQKATVSKPPVRSNPRLKPPMPLNRSSTRSLPITAPQSKARAQQAQRPG